MNKNDLEKKKLKVAMSAGRILERALKEVLDTCQRYPNSTLAQRNKTVCENAFDTLKEIRKTVKLEANKLPKGQFSIEDYTPLDEL